MAKQSLPIIDGTQALTSLEVDSGSFGYIPYHAISGTINVSASAASPVYVTGNVSVNQPINVDVDISDKLTVVVSSSANNNAVWVTSSIAYPVYTQLSNIATTGIPGAGTALVVSLSGSTGSFNQVQLYDSYVTVANTGTNQLIGYLTAAIDTGDNDYRLKVITTGSSAVSINNSAADAAFTALSSSFAENSLKVKLTGSNTVKEGAYDILLVRGTGSDAYVSNDGFNQAIYALTGSFTGDALKIKITGSNVVNENGYDVVVAKTLSGSQTTINNTSFDQVLNFVTASYNAGDNVGKFNVQLTGTNNVNVTNTPNVSASIINFPAVQLVALSGNTTIFDANTNSTGSAVGLIGTSNYVTLYNSTASVTSSKTNPVYVMSEDDKPVYITNTINNPIIVTSSTDYPVYTYEKPVSGSSTQRYDPFNGGYNWATANSGTFVVANTNTNRKSLYIFNPTEHDLYVVVGLDLGAGPVNGFLLNTTSSAPELYSFIVYPQGKYSADQHAATQYHACFFPSGSDMTLSKVFVTRIGQ